MRSSTLVSAATFGAGVSALIIPPLPSIRLPSVTLPGVALPSVTLPSVTLPGVAVPTLPSVSLPVGTLPSVSLPVGTLPSVTLPSVGVPTLPSVSLPSVSLPSVSLPGVALPSVTLPSVGVPTLPSVSLPGVALPSVTLPSVGVPTLPSVSLPVGALPSVTLPSLGLPSVTLPGVPVSTSIPGTQLPGGFSTLTTALADLVGLLSRVPTDVLTAFAKAEQVLQSFATGIKLLNSSSGSVPNLSDGGAAFVEQVVDTVCPQLQKVVAQSQTLAFPVSLLKARFQGTVNIVATGLLDALKSVPGTTAVDPQPAIDCLNDVIRANGGVATRSARAFTA